MNNELARTIDTPLIAWVGDDFTGAAATMEVLAFAGLPSILFLTTPSAEQLAEVNDMAGIGIATLARSKSPEWMEEALPPLFNLLDETGAGLVHYKICSTLDSSPDTGSIGKAIEIGQAHFGKASVPVVTAALDLRRYQAFGNLFCAATGGVYRLDRHPVMAHHPVTPMDEADVAKHISHQTDIPTGCIDLETLANGNAASELLSTTSQIWTMDVMHPDHEAKVGELLWDQRQRNRFVVGSQGVELALVAHYRRAGHLGNAEIPKGLGRNGQMAIVSGSVSPTTAAQIQWARENGFETIRLDTAAICGDEAAQQKAEADAIERALACLSAGTAPLVYTAEGPGDKAFAEVQELAGKNISQANDRIGRTLGRILKTLIEKAGLSRVAVSGGDTSGHVCETLGIYALQAAAPTIPGAAICTAKADGVMDGLEIALKGGQMGTPDYFGWIRDGGGLRE